MAVCLTNDRDTPTHVAAIACLPREDLEKDSVDRHAKREGEIHTWPHP